MHKALCARRRRQLHPVGAAFDPLAFAAEDPAAANHAAAPGPADQPMDHDSDHSGSLQLQQASHAPAPRRNPALDSDDDFDGGGFTQRLASQAAAAAVQASQPAVAAQAGAHPATPEGPHTANAIEAAAPLSSSQQAPSPQQGAEPAAANGSQHEASLSMPDRPMGAWQEASTHSPSQPKASIMSAQLQSPGQSAPPHAQHAATADASQSPVIEKPAYAAEPASQPVQGSSGQREDDDSPLPVQRSVVDLLTQAPAPAEVPEAAADLPADRASPRRSQSPTQQPGGLVDSPMGGRASPPEQQADSPAASAGPLAQPGLALPAPVQPSCISSANGIDLSRAQRPSSVATATDAVQAGDQAPSRALPALTGNVPDPAGWQEARETLQPEACQQIGSQHHLPAPASTSQTARPALGNVSQRENASVSPIADSTQQQQHDASSGAAVAVLHGHAPASLVALHAPATDVPRHATSPGCSAQDRPEHLWTHAQQTSDTAVSTRDALLACAASVPPPQQAGNMPSTAVPPAATAVRAARAGSAGPAASAKPISCLPSGHAEAAAIVGGAHPQRQSSPPLKYLAAGDGAGMLPGHKAPQVASHPPSGKQKQSKAQREAAKLQLFQWDKRLADEPLGVRPRLYPAACCLLHCRQARGSASLSASTVTLAL